MINPAVMDPPSSPAPAAAATSSAQSTRASSPEPRPPLPYLFYHDIDSALTTPPPLINLRLPPSHIHTTSPPTSALPTTHARPHCSPHSISRTGSNASSPSTAAVNTPISSPSSPPSSSTHTPRPPTPLPRCSSLTRTACRHTHAIRCRTRFTTCCSTSLCLRGC